jgi:hypothetical protein
MTVESSNAVLAARRIAWHGRRFSMRLVVLALFLAVGYPVGAADVAPSAEPERWSEPKKSDGKDGLPPGIPPTRDSEMQHRVLQLMKENRIRYGADAALMQGLLLTHSLEGDAILTTESTIVGFEESEGRKWVAFRVASGVVLNDSLERERRLERMWHIVVERTLRRYPTFTVPADGVAVELHWNHKAYRTLDDIYANVEDVGPIERGKFYLPGGDLSAFVEHRLGAQELLERSRVFLDDEPVKLRLVESPKTDDPAAAKTEETAAAKP